MLVPQTQLYPDATYGLLVSYFNNATWSGTPAVTRLEPSAAVDYGLGPAVLGLNVDNTSSRWDGQLEAPATGNVRVCITSSQDVAVFVSGTQVINSTGSVTGLCSADIAMTAGAKYPLLIEYKDAIGAASFSLSYTYPGGSEVIPSANLTPPTTFAPPANGLRVTYYDTDTFNDNLGVNPLAPRALTRFDSNIDFAWGGGRANYSELTDSDYWSARWT
jgi:hypothetical protein